MSWDSLRDQQDRDDAQWEATADLIYAAMDQERKEKEELERVHADLEERKAVRRAVREQAEAEEDFREQWRIETKGDVVALVCFLLFMCGLMVVWLGRLAGKW